MYKYSGIDIDLGCYNCCECYSCRNKRNERNERTLNKLQGEVYFASPLKFNDIIDSQLEVTNNTSDAFNNDDCKLELKLKEIFSDTDFNDIMDTKIN